MSPQTAHVPSPDEELLLGGEGRPLPPPPLASPIRLEVAALRPSGEKAKVAGLLARGSPYEWLSMGAWPAAGRSGPRGRLKEAGS